MDPVVIIGAGPAGLTAAWELSRLGTPARVLERDGIVGGIARTDVHNGYRFDIGGHRFFTKVDEVQRVWEEILGDELLVRPRLSRIFYGGVFFDYPLKPVNALAGLGLVEAARVGLSFLWARAFPIRPERTFDQWVTNRFGRRLFEIFFETYTEKVWGIPCSEIGAEWAAQRIKNLDLAKAVKAALLGGQRRDGEVITTLIERFHYPRLGPGQMWETAARTLQGRGYPTELGQDVVGLRWTERRVTEVVVRGPAGERVLPAPQVISSMPLRELVRALDPPAPPAVREAAERLRYRDFLTVVLVVDAPELFPDNWIYVHASEVRLGRIQNFGNWSPAMVPEPGRSSLGLEYFVNEDEELWRMPDAELVALGTRECAALGLIDAARVVDGCVVRMPKAYPVYDKGYQEALATLRDFLDPIENLHLVGRNGQHRYNNQDHSMLTAMYAARNIAAGTAHDLWSVNVEDEYHEEVKAPAGGDRLVPQQAAPLGAEALVRTAYARYDVAALAAACAAVGALALLGLTAVPLARGAVVEGMMLASLRSFIPGFTVSWTGAALATLGGGLYGAAAGASLAAGANAALRAHGRALLRRIEAAALGADGGGPA